MDEQRRKQAASFGSGAAAYDRARPDYPRAAVDWLVPAAARRVLDLGAGTGKLMRLLVARGLDVTALDRSAGMLAHLRDAFPSVRVVEGSAEAITLPDSSFDAVVVAQAWHWFDPSHAIPEIARVLRPGGSLSLVWNTRDISVEHVARFNEIVDRDRPSYSYDGAPMLADPFGPIEAKDVRWTYRVDEVGFLDLAASRSSYLVLAAADQREMLEEVRALFDEAAAPAQGDPTRRLIEIAYVTRCFRAAKART